MNIVGEMATWHRAADPLLAMNIQQVSPATPRSARMGEAPEMRLSLQVCEGWDMSCACMQSGGMSLAKTTHDARRTRSTHQTRLQRHQHTHTSLSIC